MSEHARKRRAERWQDFAEEDGGLFDLLDRLKAEAVDTVQASTPGAVRDGAVALLQAIEKLRGEVRAIVHHGKADAAAIEEQRKVAAGEMKRFH